ncbi:MAG: hypothetical protein OXU81_10995 [Gammaproteobacteria bacterium]|nr:hypothetical protein [Gammaproteobacteria bacterium]
MYSIRMAMLLGLVLAVPVAAEDDDKFKICVKEGGSIDSCIDKLPDGDSLKSYLESIMENKRESFLEYKANRSSGFPESFGGFWDRTPAEQFRRDLEDRISIGRIELKV